MRFNDFRNSLLLVTGVGVFVSSAFASPVVPFTEEFATGNSNWFNSVGAAPLAWNSSGGPDGSGYVEESFSFAASSAGDTPVLFRGQDEFGSSAGAFEGDYIAAGVTEFKFSVRHNAPFPLPFYARFSGPGNFPGAIAVTGGVVFPNTWTELTIPINPLNPLFVSFSGTDFATVFGASALNGFAGIGHVQVGVNVSADLAGFSAPLTFDLDKPTLVPEPTTAMLLLLGSAALIRRRG